MEYHKKFKKIKKIHSKIIQRRLQIYVKSSLCDYSDAYILVVGTITVAKETDAAPNNANKKVILMKCKKFTSCIIRINNTKVDEINILM